ncbi:MAG TPA: DUF1614 domain-containing protein [Acetobacteraceae bacterium]|nr:DUF1614 domain-containing protein [Acetobacteraceae bacterium]
MEAMLFNSMHYLPLSAPFFALLVGVLAILWVMLEIGTLRYAYMRIGLSRRGAMLILLASLLGSYFNLPIAELPARHVVSGELIDFFGMQYVVPVVSAWPGTIIAVNLGGAVIPTAVSLYLCFRHQLWRQAPVAIICVAAVSHWLAHPVAGLGIAVPVFVPALVTAVVALILSRRDAPALAYIGGSCGTLIGADLLNLDRLQGLGAPVASIGGAGTFDGIFLTGVLAVVIASLTSPGPSR